MHLQGFPIYDAQILCPGGWTTRQLDNFINSKCRTFLTSQSKTPKLDVKTKCTALFPMARMGDMTFVSFVLFWKDIVKVQKS